MIRTTLKIDGMMCGMCESHVNTLIRNQFPVKKVSSSHSKGQAEILSEEAPDEAALRAALEQLGYHLLSYETEPCEKKGKGLFRRK